MVTELTEGIGGSGIKAGVLKLATSPGEITPMEKNFLTAAAHVQKETGCRIITHTSAGTMGTQQAKILIEQGATRRKLQSDTCAETQDLIDTFPEKNPGRFFGA